MSDKEKAYWDAFSDIRVGWLRYLSEMGALIHFVDKRHELSKYLSHETVQFNVKRLGMLFRELEAEDGWE